MNNSQEKWIRYYKMPDRSMKELQHWLDTIKETVKEINEEYGSFYSLLVRMKTLGYKIIDEEAFKRIYYDKPKK